MSTAISDDVEEVKDGVGHLTNFQSFLLRFIIIHSYDSVYNGQPYMKQLKSMYLEYHVKSVKNSSNKCDELRKFIYNCNSHPYNCCFTSCNRHATKARVQPIDHRVRKKPKSYVKH